MAGRSATQVGIEYVFKDIHIEGGGRCAKMTGIPAPSSPGLPQKESPVSAQAGCPLPSPPPPHLLTDNKAMPGEN